MSPLRAKLLSGCGYEALKAKYWTDFTETD